MSPASAALPPIHRDPQYRRLWTAGMLVGLTRWVDILAFAVFTFEQTQSAFWVASLMTLRMLPLALLGLALGALAVRMSRRVLMLAAHGAMFMTYLLLLGVSIWGRVEVWHLLAASAIHGVLWASDMPVRRGLIGDIAGPRRVAQAMSLDAVAASACRLLGPLLGGVLIARGGLVAVFACGVLLSLPVLAALAGVREHRQGPRPPHRSVGALLVGGFQAARESRALKAALWLTILFNLFAWPVLSMVPVIGQERLRLDPQGVGLLASLDGVGALLGALLLSVSAGRMRHGVVYLGALLCFLALELLLAWSPQLFVTAAALLILGAAQTAFAVMQSTLAYTAAPAHRRPEAMGLMTMCIGASPLGFLAVGALAERLGTAGAIAAFSVCGLLCVALTWPLCKACLREGGPAHL